MVLSASFGSYPRPDFLREYQIKTYGHQKKIDHVPTAKDEKVLTDSFRQVVEDQTGLDIITDGMLTWDDYLASIAANFMGIKMGGLIRFYDNNTYYRRPVIFGEITNEKPTLKNNLPQLKELNPKAKTKAVIPGPYSLYRLSEDKFYTTEAEGIAAYSEALQEEVKTLDADYIQIDEPSLSYEMDQDLFPIISDAINDVVDSANGKTIIATYFGDLKSCISDISELNPDYLGIDCVSFEGNYDTLIQSGIKNVQLGLLDSRNTKIEDEINIKNKIDMIGSDDIIVSTNCGLEFLTRPYAQRKIALLSKVTNE